MWAIERMNECSAAAAVWPLTLLKTWTTSNQNRGEDPLPCPSIGCRQKPHGGQKCRACCPEHCSDRGHCISAKHNQLGPATLPPSSISSSPSAFSSNFLEWMTAPNPRLQAEGQQRGIPSLMPQHQQLQCPLEPHSGGAPVTRKSLPVLLQLEPVSATLCPPANCAAAVQIRCT